MSEKSTFAMFKRLFIFVLLFISVLTITACAQDTSDPRGSINDEAFITIGTHTVTNSQLYDALRPNATSTLSTMIEELIFAEDLAAIDLTDPIQRRQIESSINQAIFGQTTVESIVRMNPIAQARTILAFVDSIIVASPEVNGDDLIIFIEQRLAIWASDLEAGVVITNDDNVSVYAANEEEFYNFGWTNVGTNEGFMTLVEVFKLSLAQYNFAREVLGELVVDETDAQYISEADLVNLWRSQFEERHAVSALIVRFDSDAEQLLARQRWQVKPNARGEWFQLPNIFSEDAFNLISTAPVANASEDGYAYARSLLEDLGANLSSWTAFSQQVTFDSDIYTSFYERWIISTNRQTNRELPLNPEQVLRLFLAMQDDLNATRKFTNIDPAINNNEWTIDSITLLDQWNDADQAELIKELTLQWGDILFRANTVLRNEVYSLAENTLDDQDATFSRGPINLGGEDSFFLIYALATFVTPYEIIDDSDEEDLRFNVDSENADEAAAAQAARDLAERTLFERRLTSTFISNQVAERIEEAEISIYDSWISAFVNFELSVEWDGRSTDNITLASVDGKPILVDDFFERIVSVIGLSTAFDIITVEILTELYEDDITTDELELMQTQFAGILTQFRNNQLAGSGFPASIGMDLFLKLAFQATNTTEAFRNGHIVPRLRTMYAQDLNAHYGSDTAESNIYTKFAQLAKLQYENFLSVGLSHVLIYLDIDGDGSPDNPDLITDEQLAHLGFVTDEDYTALEKLQNKANELQRAITLVTSTLGATNERNLQFVIDQYNQSTRFGNPLLPPETGGVITGRDRWTEFRQIGFRLRLENLGTINNSTNNPGSPSQFDARFFAHTMFYANAIKDILGDDPATGAVNAILPLWVPSAGQDSLPVFDIDDARSDFGWHLLLITTYSTGPSALLAAPDTGELDQRFVSSVENPWFDDEAEETYYNNKYLTAYNPNRWLSAQQIQIFIEESRLETGVETLNTAMNSAITSYFTPVFAIYQSPSNTLELTFRLLAQHANATINDEGFLPDLGSDALNARAQLLRSTNLNTMFGYSLFFTTTPNTFQVVAQVPNFYALFGQWFTILTA